MNGRGRPLRFVAVVAVGWAGARTAMLWPPGASLPEAIEEAFPIQEAVAALAPVAATRTAEMASAWSDSRTAAPTATTQAAAVAEAPHARTQTVEMEPVAARQILGTPPGALPAAPLAPDALPAPTPRASRWSASGWVVTRRGAPAGGAMLGGDQAGVRLAYAVGGAQLYARATAPLAQPGREVAAGVDWRPTKLPVRIAAEYRAGLDGVPGGPALAAVGGIDAIKLPLAFALESYAQAGAVWRERLDPFADGAMRVTRRVGNIGRGLIVVGGGVWGAAQRETARLDIGPSAVATVPLGDTAIRIALDWRERVAGDARPGSGPALSIGADF